MEGVYRKQRKKAIALRGRESVRAEKRKRERERKRGMDGTGLVLAVTGPA